MIIGEQKVSYKSGENMQDIIKTRLQVEIEKSYYASKRYHQESTFAILYHEKKLPIEVLGNILRVSDQLIQTDEHHYFVFFKFTNHQQAFKASENLLLELDTYFNDSTSYIGIDRFDINQSPTIVINRLIQILYEIKKGQFLRIEDESILSEIIF